MKLFKVERTDSWSYDDYDSFVCIAPTAEAARWLHPNGDFYSWKEDGLYFNYADGTSVKKPDDYQYSAWTMKPDTLKVTELGEAYSDKAEVILASFNAG